MTTFELHVQCLNQIDMQRAVDVGYECGAGSWAYGHGLSSGLLGRMAAVGASLRLTLYPADPRSP